MAFMTKVLFVDDDEVTQFLYKRMAKNSAVEAFYAANGEEALSQLAASKPDLIFLDLNMPVLGGEGFLKQVKGQENLPEIFVMLGTSLNANNEMADKGYPITDFIRKPLNADILKDLLTKFNNKG